mmetsp:Transcript_9121/g.18456  ORF Transcript_9121/g.18456 Transcript_9121/m.18456 type:complete len:90 (+) Transcript_9121:569-838(+)
MFLRLGTMEILGDDVVSRVADHGVGSMGEFSILGVGEAKYTPLVPVVKRSRPDVASARPILPVQLFGEVFYSVENIPSARFWNMHVEVL